VYVPDYGVLILLELFSRKMGVFLPKRWMHIFPKMEAFSPKDGAGFPWRWNLLPQKKRLMLIFPAVEAFCPKRRMPYFPEGGGLFPQFPPFLVMGAIFPWKQGCFP
jgi:hypothetical protein